MKISNTRFRNSIEVAKSFCPFELIQWLSPELIEDPGRNIYDSRVRRVVVESQDGPKSSLGSVEFLIEGPTGDQSCRLIFGGVSEMKIGRLDLTQLPDVLTLEFEMNSGTKGCRFHFMSTEEDMFLIFGSVRFELV